MRVLVKTKLVEVCVIRIIARHAVICKMAGDSAERDPENFRCNQVSILRSRALLAAKRDAQNSWSKPLANEPSVDILNVLRHQN